MLVTFDGHLLIQTMYFVVGRVQLDDGGRYRIVLLAKPDRIIKRDILVIGE